MFEEYNRCNLCPRNCRVNRNIGEKGQCGETSDVRVGRASLHMWEEPIISGKNGSGTVFFSGCNLKCVYCQNYQLSKEHRGTEVTKERLAKMFLELELEGAHNINLVTAEHFAPQICASIDIARNNGLKIPIILNSSGYTSISTLRKLKKYIDVYLVDFKYYSPEIADRYSKAMDYHEIANNAIAEMVRQQPKLLYDKNGMLNKGVVVRHLCLPGHIDDSKKILKELFEKYDNNICYSIMSQFTPTESSKKFPPLDKKITQKEYDSIVDYCIELGIVNAFIQDGESASESFVPEFNGV